MPIMTTWKEQHAVPVKVWTADIEDSAREQLRNLSTLPFIHKHIAVMPDVHAGMGSTIGTVLPTIKAIVPSCVGVDLGCGMMAAKLNISASQLPDSLFGIRGAIETRIPHGRTDNGGPNDRGAWGLMPNVVIDAWTPLIEDWRYKRLCERHPEFASPRVNTARHLGTLGTGNHFIELCLDKGNGVWLMLHSGSRGIGNKIGSYFIEKAKEEMVRWHVALADPALAYLPEGSQYFDDYWQSVSWAQDYARRNREIMFARALAAIGDIIGVNADISETAVNCHHNYVTLENHFGKNVYVTRKGAVRARKGDLGIIPGSMGTRSFIVRGKGNPESFNSCSHGAGRCMGRKEAQRRFTVEDLARQTKGIECRKDADVIDEIPSAYKNIDIVMKNQDDLVEIVAELKQVLCVKG